MSIERKGRFLIYSGDNSDSSANPGSPSQSPTPPPPSSPNRNAGPPQSLAQPPPNVNLNLGLEPRLSPPGSAAPSRDRRQGRHHHRKSRERKMASPSGNRPSQTLQQPQPQQQTHSQFETPQQERQQQQSPLLPTPQHQSQQQPSPLFQTPQRQLQQQPSPLFQTPQHQSQQQPSSLFQTPQHQSQQQPSPLFQTPQHQSQQQPSPLFQTPQHQSQQQPPPFQTPQPQGQQFLQQSTPFPSFQDLLQFQLHLQQQQPTGAAMFMPGAQQQPQLFLYTKDGVPAGYETKFEDLRHESQKILLQIDERIQEYKDESERLDQCSRLYDSSSDSFALDAERIIQELSWNTAAIERERAHAQELITSLNKMMWDTHFAVRSFMMLRPSFLRQNVPNAARVSPDSQNMGRMAFIPAPSFYSGLPKKPSIFMEHTVARLEKYLSECHQWIENLEKLVMMDTGTTSANAIEALPKVLSNVHDFFIYVVAKVERLHEYVESMKKAYIAHQRR